jgi:hypothetical protein
MLAEPLDLNSFCSINPWLLDYWTIYFVIFGIFDISECLQWLPTSLEWYSVGRIWMDCWTVGKSMLLFYHFLIQLIIVPQNIRTILKIRDLLISLAKSIFYTMADFQGKTVGVRNTLHNKKYKFYNWQIYAFFRSNLRTFPQSHHFFMNLIGPCTLLKQITHNSLIVPQNHCKFFCEICCFISFKPPWMNF